MKKRETWWNRPVRKGLSTFHRGVEGHEGVESISAKLYLNFEIGFQTLNCKNSCRNLTNSKAREREWRVICVKLIVLEADSLTLFNGSGVPLPFSWVWYYNYTSHFLDCLLLLKITNYYSPSVPNYKIIIDSLKINLKIF